MTEPLETRWADDPDPCEVHYLESDIINTLHAAGWSEEQIKEYMVERAARDV